MDARTGCSTDDYLVRAMRKCYQWTVGVTRYVDVTFPFLSLLSGRLWVQRMRKYLGLADRVCSPL